MPVTKRARVAKCGVERLGLLLCAAALATALAPQAAASSDAPQWMHSLVGISLPSYDEKTEAVLLYSDTSVTVLSEDKVRTHVRKAYKILRPEGRERGIVGVEFYPGKKLRICMDGAFRRKARTMRSRRKMRWKPPRPKGSKCFRM